MFGPVAEALLAMLEDRMGSDMFTPDVKDAWTTAYVLVSENMVKGLRKAQKTATTARRKSYGSVWKTSREQ
jgi:hemoglobin-like flavoprotein